MIEEACKLLRRLFEKYKDGHHQDWVKVFDELVEIFSQHRAMGAPYSEMFQPLICKMLCQVCRGEVNPEHLLPLINVMKYMEDKALVPPECRQIVAQLIVLCVKNSVRVSHLPPSELFNYYKALNLPELPYVETALQAERGGGAGLIHSLQAA